MSTTFLASSLQSAIISSNYKVQLLPVQHTRMLSFALSGPNCCLSGLSMLNTAEQKNMSEPRALYLTGRPLSVAAVLQHHDVSVLVQYSERLDLVAFETLGTRSLPAVRCPDLGCGPEGKLGQDAALV